MIKRKLKDWILPLLGVVIVAGILICYYLIISIRNHNLSLEQYYVTDALIEDSTPVSDIIVENIPTLPYDDSNVTISKYYYDNSDDETKQQNSLIQYESIFMPNTGILYSSDTEFNIISVANGTVKNIKEDNILGTIIEISQDDGYYVVYQSVKDVEIKVGDKVTSGQIIATSSSNKLQNEKSNCLHFEVYKDGSLVNPQKYLNNETE